MKDEKKDVVTVLMSTYNGEKYIKEQLESILGQEGNFFLKVIIRDDGSTDATCRIVERMIENNSDVILRKEKNIGVNESFFNLIECAPNSDYYAIADQDDIWLPNKIQVAINALKNDPKKMLYGSSSICVDEKMNYIVKNPIIYKPITLYNTMIQNFIGGHTQVFNHKFIEIIKRDYDLKNIFAYDAYFTNVAMLYNALYFDENSYVYYRLHENNLVGTGTSFIDWLEKNWRRIKKGQGHQYSKQFDYIFKKYSNLLEDRDKRQFELFIKMRRNLGLRFIYIWKMPFYRQSRKETLIFKLLYLCGGWK